jgi:hypothetical protein
MTTEIIYFPDGGFAAGGGMGFGSGPLEIGVESENDDFCTETGDRGA